MADTPQDASFIELTADIVSAYLSKNTVSTGDLAGLIQDVHAALQESASGPSEPELEPLAPAVSVRKSVTPDYIVCLEDGKKFKALKRHLQTDHNLSPQEYRAKWGLSRDYPMVAASYAASRSEMAKKIGLGRSIQGGSEAEASGSSSKRRGRGSGG